MTNEEFLKDVCPNHTEKSKWNRSELLHILELHKEAINFTDSSPQLPTREESIIELKKQLKIYSEIEAPPYHTKEFVIGYDNAFVDYWKWLQQR